MIKDVNHAIYTQFFESFIFSQLNIPCFVDFCIPNSKSDSSAITQSLALIQADLLKNLNIVFSPNSHKL